MKSTKITITSLLRTLLFHLSPTTRISKEWLRFTRKTCILHSQFTPLLIPVLHRQKNKGKKKRKVANDSAKCDGLVPARIPLPRILKSDIRRKYGTFFANVFNSGEYQFMWSFLDTLVEPNFLYTMKKTGITDPVLTIVSKQTLAEYWYQRMHDAPDQLFTIDRSRLKVRSDGTAVFSTRFNISGTIVISNMEQQKAYESKVAGVPCTGEPYDTQVEDIHNKDDSSLSDFSQNAGSNEVDEDIVEALVNDPVQKLAEVINSDQAVTEFQPKLIDYLVTGVISMHLDSDSRITMLEMVIDADNSKGQPWKPPASGPILANIEY